MIKVITYGTFDMLHYGHVRLLERAKKLGDYLIVGITSDDYDKSRGKINAKQSLIERIEAVKNTGIADEIIVEEYSGQKIDDIRRMDVDIFTVGSDWVGRFDYLNEYCKVIYLERTEGISSTQLRTEERTLRLGFVGEAFILNKFYRESRFVNGLEVTAVYTESKAELLDELLQITYDEDKYDEFLDHVEAIYIVSHPAEHYQQIKQAIKRGVHVLCEAPIVTTIHQLEELKQLAKERNCVFVDALRTVYSTAYSRLLLLIKSGIIGEVFSVDATCTSLRDINIKEQGLVSKRWNSICTWGPTAMLPIFQLLGTEYVKKTIVTNFADECMLYDNFTKIDFIYTDAVASLKVGKGVKSEGELVISGTKGYAYVPAPWWKTDYFEIRYENPADNKRYFYQLDGEGIRYELVAFIKAIEKGKSTPYIEEHVSRAIVKIISDFNSGIDRVIIRK